MLNEFVLTQNIFNLCSIITTSAKPQATASFGLHMIQDCHLWYLAIDYKKDQQRFLIVKLILGYHRPQILKIFLI